MTVFTVKAQLFGIWLLTNFCMFLSLFLWDSAWLWGRGSASFGAFLIGPVITVIICWIGGRQMASKLHLEIVLMSWVYACLIATSFVGIVFGACHWMRHWESSRLETFG